MGKEIKNKNVSRGTFELLKRYEASLHEWQQRFNLVSNTSLGDSWDRHFVDSMQLYDLVPESATSLCDFGSGAGFPGMVLAIMSKDRTPSLKVVLVESINKKTLYLKHVAEETNTNIRIVNDRIENLKPEKFDVITSRALTSLKDLLGYAHRFCHFNTVCIFPKGKSYQEEIVEAKKYWKFDVEIISSQTTSEGRILKITHLKKL